MSYRRSGAELAELIGHKYVGRVRTADFDLDVVEKVPGALRSLIAAATGSELAIEKLNSPATDFDLVSRHLMGEFTRSAGRYIAERRKPRYQYQRTASPALAGSLDMAATLRLHASGHPGMFAYWEGAVVRDDPLDRLVLAALDELAKGATALKLDRKTVYDARWLASALDEVRDQDFLAQSVSDFLALGDEIGCDANALPPDADLAQLAAVVLLHRGFQPDRPGASDVPRSLFVDLETLFEQAVRRTLAMLLPSHQVDRGERYARRMFRGGSDSSRVNPDIAIHAEGVMGAVGDVKYKALATTRQRPGAMRRLKKEGRPDIYQVLVHAAAMDAERAFLVYPGDDVYRCRYLGRSATGCGTWITHVRPTDLASDLSRFLDESGLAP